MPDGAQSKPARKHSSWRAIARLPRFARELAEYSYTAFARPRLFNLLERERPDFLYERYAFGNAAGVIAARRAKLPIVLEVNSPMVQELARTRGLSFARTADRMERFIFREATRVCVVTDVLGEMLVELGVERRRIFTTPNGVHLEQFDYADRQALRTRARKDLGLPNDALVLGFVGYFRDWHRLDLVVEALTQLPGAVLALVGEGPAADALRQRAQQCRTLERVHFCGTRPHAAIPNLLPAFDIALVPAINAYASPLKLHEYMAASLATIAPDQNNLRELLRDGENALLVPSGDGAALNAALARLADDAALRASLGQAARRTIEERNLTWRGNAQRVLREITDMRARGESAW